MKKILSAIILACMLSACATDGGFVKTDVVVQTKYVVRQATDQQKALPQYPTPIDVNTATQLQLAEWIKQSEERQWTLEAIITGLIVFYERDPSDEEKMKTANVLRAAKAAAAPPSAPSGTSDAQ